jgi:hypothetical protein
MENLKMAQTRQSPISKKLKAGIYTAKVKSVKRIEDNKFQLTLAIDSKDKKTVISHKMIVSGDSRPCDPEEGQQKYFIANSRLGVYTAMGADNRHHASNKATKLWGLHGWTSLTLYAPTSLAEVSVVEFGELAKTLRS